MIHKLSENLLAWYATCGRDLPWRYKGGAHPNPYAVLVSEVMLQQTTVKTVVPYFEKFMKRFPSVEDLAAASQEQVFEYWQGLGYYTRARSLLKTAQQIVYERDGKFPETKKEALSLKGIGKYTAASFLALAFNQPETVVDGNVTRVICRLYHLDQPVETIQNLIFEKARKLTPKKNAADYVSAIMDLGATVCTPKNPQCFRCPWQAYCRSKDKADLENIPAKKRPEKLTKTGFVCVIKNKKGEVFIRKRAEKGLLHGLYELPWTEDKKPKGALETEESVVHVFTHFKLVLKICTAKSDVLSHEDGIFVEPDKFFDYPTSTLMKKVFSKLSSTGHLTNL